MTAEILGARDVACADLHLFHKNPRVGNVDAIAGSLRVNGQYRPIVVNRGSLTDRPMEVLAGNHTLLAARLIGWKKIAVVELDVDDETATRIVLADNRTAELGTYDEALLADILGELPDLDGTGYTSETFEDLLDKISLADLPDALQLETNNGEGGQRGQLLPMLRFAQREVPLTIGEMENFETLAKAWIEGHGELTGILAFLLDMDSEAEA